MNSEDDIEWRIDLGDSTSFVMQYGTEPLDLTGYTVEPFAVASTLTGKITAEFSDRAERKVRISIASAFDLPLRKSQHFRVRMVPPGGNLNAAKTFPLIRVVAL